jgi:hypothetical protein
VVALREYDEYCNQFALVFFFFFAYGFDAKNYNHDEKNLGLEATCSFSYKFVFPARLIHEKFSNARMTDRFTGLVCQLVETRKVNNRERECANIRHDDFASELHAVLCRVIVVPEGLEFEDAVPISAEGELARELP